MAGPAARSAPEDETGQRGNADSKPEDQPGTPQPYKPEEKRPAPQPQPSVPDDNSPADGNSSPTAAPGTPGGGYSVCVSSYSSEEAARRDQTLYQKLGQVFIIAADIPGKGRWYRICVGQYASRAQAQNQANQWRGSGTAKGAFAVTLPDL
jgi:cell division septation protein DedD